MIQQRNVALLFLLVALPFSSPGIAQTLLAPPSKAGLTVTPVYEGWYRNPDGSFSLSFGYFNRNAAEVLEIPVGPDNFFEPGPANRGQPTHFQPRRNWGVFAINVPADFGYERLVWTIRIRGETFAVPGSLNRDWEIDALAGEADSGNTPPLIRFVARELAGAGPLGSTGAPLTAAVGRPLEVSVWAEDDGKSAGAVSDPGETGKPITLTWFKHQGPGDVSFSESSHEVPYQGGEAKTLATFGQPGTYVLRVRANDASGVEGAGYAQCCWTNGFVEISVTE
jgi:hypothetical protein